MRGAVVGLSLFVVVCLAGIFALMAIFTQMRFTAERTYQADFTDVSGLKSGDFVRIAGVEVGKVKEVRINAQSTATVEFAVDDSVVLTSGAKAAVRWADPIGNRYMALLEGPGASSRLSPGSTIPTSHTQPALDIDSLLGGFRPLFRSLDPEQVNALSSQLISAFQGEGPTINSFLSNAAKVTNTLADHDELIGQVITNLNTVLNTLSGQSEQIGRTVDALSDLMQGLAARKTDIGTAVAHTNAAAGTVTDLLRDARSPLKDAVAQSDRVSSIIVSDHEYVENLLDTLPDTYKRLSRLGLYGDFFTFYLCDVILKVNGKGGQPVYVKAAGQDTGRCAPK